MGGRNGKDGDSGRGFGAGPDSHGGGLISPLLKKKLFRLFVTNLPKITTKDIIIINIINTKIICFFLYLVIAFDFFSIIYPFLNHLS